MSEYYDDVERVCICGPGDDIREDYDASEYGVGKGMLQYKSYQAVKRALYLPEHAAPNFDPVDRWLVASGPDWTESHLISREKSLARGGVQSVKYICEND